MWPPHWPPQTAAARNALDINYGSVLLQSDDRKYALLKLARRYPSYLCRTPSSFTEILQLNHIADERICLRFVTILWIMEWLHICSSCRPIYSEAHKLLRYHSFETAG